MERLYLHKTTNFGHVLRNDGLDRRINLLNKHRKTVRNVLYCNNRNMTTLDGASMSENRLDVEEHDRKAEERRLKLEKWKQEKERKKLELRNNKPIFKVQHVPQSIGMQDLSRIYKNIKDKPIKMMTNNKTLVPVKDSKTPLLRSVCGYDLRPRKEVQPAINEKKNKTKNANRRPENTKKTYEKPPNNNIVTANKNKTPEIHKKDEVVENNEVENNEQTPITNKINEVSEEPVPVVYISPFVTMSRGKENARKEHFKRKSSVGENEATYFYEIIKNQTDRINILCKEWQKLKDNGDKLPEEAADMINVAIGQSQLLISQKFRQFRTLIDNYSMQDPKKDIVITSEDLHGFWDMVLLQVTNINKRFENLNSLKISNWEEILPAVTKPEVKKKSKQKKVEATSRLKNFLRAARNKKVSNANKENTPKNGRVSSVRKSRKSINSPGLLVLSASQSAKSLLNPPKSILKSAKSSADSQLSNKKQKVVFSRECSSGQEDLINFNSPALHECNGNQRRSLRQTKLF